MGLDILLDAFAAIAPSVPGARLWLTGRGPAEASLRSRIERHGLAGSVRLLGFLPGTNCPAC
jgi:glycosyltransferase involved in cell wall biosynthesis